MSSLNPRIINGCSVWVESSPSLLQQCIEYRYIVRTIKSVYIGANVQNIMSIAGDTAQVLAELQENIATNESLTLTVDDTIARLEWIENEETVGFDLISIARDSHIDGCAQIGVPKSEIIEKAFKLPVGAIDDIDPAPQFINCFECYFIHDKSMSDTMIDRARKLYPSMLYKYNNILCIDRKRAWAFLKC